MANFLNPENALKRAEELINVGQKQDALQSLHNVIISKRSRGWQQPLHRFMLKYLELCVELRKTTFAKDGLIKYRNICQQVNVSSLEDVIKHFMDLSSQKAEQVVRQEEALDVDDIGADRRPEDLMLSYVEGEDREVATPWIKFLWESYKTVLDILWNNSKFDALYAMTAKLALQFCKKYKRTTEFHRLCGTFRKHLANLNKNTDHRDQAGLSSPQSLRLYLDTKFHQLKTATELELWQEVFPCLEDIHKLISMVKETPVALIVVYYAKLAEFFWVSDSHLNHAYALLKLFTVEKSFNSNISQMDLQLIASSVVLAALSVSPYSAASHSELKKEEECNSRMSNLLEFSTDPERGVLTRSSLLSELVSTGVLSYATQEVKDLYQLLEYEHELLPTELALKMQPLLIIISQSEGQLSSASSVPELQLSRYVHALEKVGSLRLLQQVSQVYQTMKIQDLSSIIPFYDFSVVEKLYVDAVKHEFISIPMKVDHMAGVVSFGNLGSEYDHLSNILAESIKKTMDMICPPSKSASKLGKVLPCSAETFEKSILARISVIEKIIEEQELQLLEREKMIEEQERQLLEKEREEELKMLKLHKVTEEAEQKGEMEECKLEEAQPLKKLVSERVKVVPKENPMDKIKQREKKYQKLAKTIDHLERAKREESAPLIEAAYQKSYQQGLVEERERHKHEQQIRIQLKIFKDKVMDRRRAESERREAEWKEKITPVIEVRKQEREALRKKLYYLRCEEERLKKLHEEEDERQKQLEEKESLRRQAEPSEQPHPVKPAVAPSTAKYVVKHRTTEDCPPQPSNDTWRSSDDRSKVLKNAGR